MADFTYDDAMSALRKADAAGNVDDAKRLAQIADRMRPKETAKQAAPAPAQPDDQEDPYNRSFIGQNVLRGAKDIAAGPANVVQGYARSAADIGARMYDLFGGKGGKAAKPVIPGSSEWWEQQGREKGVFTKKGDPETKGGEYAAAMLQALPSAALGGPGLTQIPRALSAAATSGAASKALSDIAPEGWESAFGLAGSLLPGGPKKMMTKETGTEAAEGARRGAAYAQAKEAGIPMPPRFMKPDQQLIQLETLVRKGLGLEEGAILGRPRMKQYRQTQYQKGYEPLQTEPGLKGKITSDTEFQDAMKEMGKSEAALRQEFKGTVGVDKELGKMLADYNKPEFTLENTMKVIAHLREAAGSNIQPGATGAELRLGHIQADVAEQMESLVERNVAGLNKPELLANFREARTKMAQAHVVEESVDPGAQRINPGKLAAARNYRPLTGQLKQAADIAGEFPGAFAAHQPHGVEDWWTRRATPMAVEHPVAAGAHFATKLIEPMQKTAPYQRFFVDPKWQLGRDQERVIRMLIGGGQADEGQIPMPQQ